MKFYRLRNFLAIFLFALVFFNNKAFSNQATQNSDSKVISLDYLDFVPSDEYILGPGDLLKIYVSREIPSLNGEYLIDQSGMINMPEIKRIYVAGLSVNELINLLTKKFAEIVRDPNLEVYVQSYRPLAIFIDGEVNFPGLYLLNVLKNLENQETTNQNQLISTYLFPSVFDGIRKAGGITAFADLTSIEVSRQETITEGGKRKKTNLNFVDFLMGGNNIQNIKLRDGDRIFVPRNSDNLTTDGQLSKAIKLNLNPRFISIYISGAINNEPRLLEIPKGTSVTEAVQIAGGTQTLASKNVTFKRFSQDGDIDSRIIKLNTSAKKGSFKNPILKSGDLLFVNKGILKSSNDVLTEVTKPFVGVFSVYGLFNAVND